jgi:hypothetical protein
MDWFLSGMSKGQQTHHSQSPGQGQGTAPMSIPVPQLQVRCVWVIMCQAWLSSVLSNRQGLAGIAGLLLLMLTSPCTPCPCAG